MFASGFVIQIYPAFSHLRRQSCRKVFLCKFIWDLCRFAT